MSNVISEKNERHVVAFTENNNTKSNPTCFFHGMKKQISDAFQNGWPTRLAPPLTASPSTSMDSSGLKNFDFFCETGRKDLCYVFSE